MSKSETCPGPISRRSFVQLGSIGASSLAMSDLLRMRAAGKTLESREDTSVIFVWLPGGLSHLESYDMKPNAPVENRGDFRPIPTNVPGMDICELFPQQARIADKYNIIRSVAHEFADHGGGHKRFMTARTPREPVGFVNDFPAQPSIISKMRGRSKNGLPNYIVAGNRGNIDTFSFGSSYLGTATHPFMVNSDPADPKFKVENLGIDESMERRVGNRLDLLKGFDRLRRDFDRSGMMSSMDEFNLRAFDLMTSERARKAFDMSLEPQHVRDRFGHHCFGQRGLLALRLVEAGCSFVTLVWENPSPPGTSIPTFASYNWDSHAVNADIFKEAREWRFAFYDQAVTALIEGLYERGLDKKTLVVITGEFGRTPRVNPAIGTQTKVMQPGRDHWPGAMSFIVSGGGMRTGQIVGATNSKGEHPVDRKLSPNDLWTSIYRHLGLNPAHAFPDPSGRPMPAIPTGEPIPEMASVS